MKGEMVMPDTESGRERLIRLEVQLDGLREQHKAHSERTEKLFTKLFEGVDELKAVMNQGKGAYAVSLMVAGAIGGVIVKTMGYFLGKMGGQ